jgi:glycerophosphoryl diester phosphodiesterase
MKIKKKRVPILILALLLALLFLGNVYGETSKSNYRSFANAKELQAYMRWHLGKAPLISAHRGGPMEGFPENAIETFENTLRYGPCLIECDVRITKDGHLVMMHDATLDRTTNGSGRVSDYTLEELKRLFLKDNKNKLTGCRIPTFGETLQWAVGRAILTVDVKKDVPINRIISEIQKHKADGHAIIIVYNLGDLKKVHQLAPSLMISASARGIIGVKKLFSTGVPAENICAFVGVYEPEPRVYEILHKNGVAAILGTMHNLDNKAVARGISVYQKLFRNGADILATDNVPLVSQAIKDWKSKFEN